MPRGARAYIGTSGWQYDAWRGPFYPEDVPKRLWLEEYARRFPSVEVNGSYYSLPRRHVVEEWVQRVPADFRFTMKMWRGVSHYKKLQDAEEHLRRFFAPLEPLEGQRRGPVLVQLPPNFGKNAARLDAFLEDLRAVTRPALWKVAVEFRHASWLDQETWETLASHGAVPVVHDMPPAVTQDAGDGSLVYVRRHGPGGDTSRGYRLQDIEQDARRVLEWQDEGRTVYVYYNNDGDAHAPADAQRLAQRTVGRRDAEAEQVSAVTS